MDTIKINKRKTKLIAHRGLSGIERENTNAAFVAAANRSYYGIETDVHITSDGKIAVIHDNDMKRLCGADMVIEQSSLDELKKLRMKDMDGAERDDLHIGEMSEYIRICKKYGKIAVLELKNEMKASDIQKITEQISSLGYLDYTIFISFAWSNLVQVKRLAPNQRVQYLTTACTDELIKKMNEAGFEIDIEYKALSKQLVKKLHKNSIQINCWTCDDAAIAEKLVRWGVDFITTNILE